MFSHIKGKLNVAVNNAAKKGNPLAKHLVAGEVQRFVETLPEQSPIVEGPYLIPDLSRPLPEEEQGGLLGDYEMLEFAPDPVAEKTLQGCRILSLMTSLGSYGMGSYGFLGLLFDDDNWLIVPISGAASWVHYSGRILEADGQKGHDPWIVDGDDTKLQEAISGQAILDADIRSDRLSIELENMSFLTIESDFETRPRFAATDKPRKFSPSDDLSQAVFLSPSGELSV